MTEPETMTSPPGFEDADLAAAVGRLSPAEIDRLPYGVVRLDGTGKVVLFSRSEASLSGYGDRPALGLHFFTEIAPCMNKPEYRGRLDRGLASGKLNARFTWIGDFADRDRVLQVRLLGIDGGGCWIFMQREG